MHQQAPIQYIRDYYSRAHEKAKQFPDIADFWLSALKHINAKRVLNLGCGSLFYDNVLHFGSIPETYVGLDINESSFEFLRTSKAEKLLKGKRALEAAGAQVELICADVFELGDRFGGQFDAVFGIGFFEMLHGPRFSELMAVVHNALVDDGMLLKMTWHTGHYSSEEQRRKFAFGYDSPDNPGPDNLVADIIKSGFSLEDEQILKCDPAEIGWEAIQVCVFRKSPLTGGVF